MTGLGGITRYQCPLPDCGWTTEVLPSDGPMGVELALRQHADSHSALEYVRALVAAQERNRVQAEVCGLLSQWAPRLMETNPVLFRKLDDLLQLSQPADGS